MIVEFGGITPYEKIIIMGKGTRPYMSFTRHNFMYPVEDIIENTTPEEFETKIVNLIENIL